MSASLPLVASAAGPIMLDQEVVEQMRAGRGEARAVLLLRYGGAAWAAAVRALTQLAVGDVERRVERAMSEALTRLCDETHEGGSRDAPLAGRSQLGSCLQTLLREQLLAGMTGADRARLMAALPATMSFGVRGALPVETMTRLMRSGGGPTDEARGGAAARTMLWALVAAAGIGLGLLRTAGPVGEPALESGDPPVASGASVEREPTLAFAAE